MIFVIEKTHVHSSEILHVSPIRYWFGVSEKSSTGPTHHWLFTVICKNGRVFGVLDKCDGETSEKSDFILGAHKELRKYEKDTEITYIEKD